MIVLTMTLWYVVVSAFTAWAFAYDKEQARNRGRRVAESTLHLLTIAGGATGALIAMELYRHKTRHMSFWIIGWSALALHLALLVVVQSGVLPLHTVGFCISPQKGKVNDIGYEVTAIGVPAPPPSCRRRSAPAPA